jgi:hypothetical protein
MVSNRNRVIYKAIKHGRVLADYDQLWEELGAQRRQRRLRDGVRGAGGAGPGGGRVEEAGGGQEAARDVCGLAEGVCVSLRARQVQAATSALTASL